MRVIDENGNIFSSVREVAKSYNKKAPNGAVYDRLRKNGKVTYAGHTLIMIDENTPNKAPEEVSKDPLMEKLRKRYTESELEMIARGEGIEKRFIPFPQIRLEGEHHRILVMSDTHIGSVYSPCEWHDVVSEYANNPKNGIECILHLGDLTDGMKVSRIGTQIYELSDIGFEAQKNRAIELMGKYQKPIYIISGNHDAFYKENAGVDIVKAVASALPNMTYVGYNSADIKAGGTTIRLFHGGDSNSYAHSYRLQKLIESITGGNKPNILLCGHTHKYVSVFERNIFAISCPAMQSQTKWMEGKKIASHTGFLVLDFDTLDGEVRNLAVQLFPFYA